MIVLRCTCCGLPWGRMENGKIIVQSRHHGEVHANQIDVSELVEMCQKESAPDGNDNRIT